MVIWSADLAQLDELAADAAAAPVADAFKLMYWLEQACRIQVDAQGSGVELIRQDRRVSEHMREQMSRSFSTTADIAWEAVVRKMDRIAPSYRT